MASFLVIAGGIIGIGALGSFLGTTASNLLFSNDKNEEKTTNEIKTEIKVMSNEIKQINLIEVIIVCVVVFVVLSVILIAIAAYCNKKCRKNRINKNVISYVPREHENA